MTFLVEIVIRGINKYNISLCFRQLGFKDFQKKKVFGEIEKGRFSINISRKDLEIRLN